MLLETPPTSSLQLRIGFYTLMARLESDNEAQSRGSIVLRNKLDNVRKSFGNRESNKRSFQRATAMFRAIPIQSRGTHDQCRFPSVVAHPSPNNVLFGRGKPNQQHPGNVLLNSLVGAMRELYDTSSRRHTRLVVLDYRGTGSRYRRPLLEGLGHASWHVGRGR